MNFTAGLVFALSTVLGGSTPAQAASLVTPPVPQPQTVEQYVRNYFADQPVMIAIASCESRFTQFTANGDVVKNPHSSAVGVFQIMSSIHSSFADDSFGLDINTLQGNAAYARYLYDKQGTVPWNDSKSCWGKSAAAKAQAQALAVAK